MMLRLAAAAAVLAFAGSAAAASALPARSARAGAMARLNGLEGRAEAIAGGEATGATARAVARQVVSEWPALRAAFATNPRARYALLAVDGQIAALGSAESDAARRLAANETTGALAPLFDLAGDRVPVAIRLIDYLGRAIALDASSADWARASADGAQLDRAWFGLRPVVLQQPGGTPAATRADQAVAAVEAAVAAHDAARVNAAARKSGDAAEELEKVYRT